MMHRVIKWAIVSTVSGVILLCSATVLAYCVYNHSAKDVEVRDVTLDYRFMDRLDAELKPGEYKCCSGDQKDCQGAKLRAKFEGASGLSHQGMSEIVTVPAYARVDVYDGDKGRLVLKLSL